MVTRDDVARMAGTSTAVVSYVVNNGPRRVSEKTRAKVLAAIEELGYRPNGFARALRSTRSRLLGLVLPDNSNPFFAELARVIEDEAFRRGYLLLLGNSTENDERQAAYVREFLELRVEGLLLISAAHGDTGAASSLDELQGARIRTVVIDRGIPGLQASYLSVDNFSGGYLATRHLLGHGHPDVTCLAGPEGTRPSESRTRGWRRAMREAGRVPGPGLLVRSEFRREAGYQVMRERLQAGPPPAAVFAESDEQAIGVLRATSECGVRVPEDLALVSFDGIPESAFTRPQLTTVAQPFDELGRRAVELAVSATGPDGPRRVRLPVALTIGDSCGCHPANLTTS
ncbi:MAG TPA: LacI family DNA-binding transcriptional regulator [Streptosporangiaceae bacterium]|nr:LacI family DNA-binding transcriptional regulator [Streptosporangiaceae bacterium]